MPASLALAVRALTAAADPPFSDIALTRAASASAISVGAERAAVTVETLITEAEEARSKAADKGGAAAAVAAITVKAKLAGLWRDKVAVTDPSGERAPRYLISDHPMTEEEWKRERCR
jgi:hypothetical protein